MYLNKFESYEQDEINLNIAGEILIIAHYLKLTLLS